MFLDLQVKSSGFDAIIARLQAFRDRLLDLEGLARRIAVILVEQNEVARTAGIDRFGQPFAELAVSTRQDRRRGPGPALAPNGPASSVIANVRTTITRIDESRWRVRLEFTDAPWLIHHVIGTARMPSRDPVGVTPDGRAEIELAIRQAIVSYWSA